MALSVSEIVNRELFRTRSEDPAEQVLRELLALGIQSAPVVDAEDRPIGVVSLADLVGCEPDGQEVAGARMSAPAITIQDGAPIAHAARLMAEAEIHHLTVVDESGRAVGHLSSLDVVRALAGLPARHPWTFPHYDRRTGFVWSDDQPLDFDHVELAPAERGLLVLVHGGAGEAERPAWGELAEDVRGRLIEMLTAPERENVAVAHWLRRGGGLRFRTAKFPSVRGRKRAEAALLEQMERPPR
jgi:CBS domain-containing protein